MARIASLRMTQPLRNRRAQFPAASEFGCELETPVGREPVGLLIARGVGLVEALDPAIFEQTPQGAIQRPGAQLHGSAAQAFDVLEQRVAVARRIGEAGEDQQHRLGKSFGDMSHNDTLTPINFRWGARRDRSPGLPPAVWPLRASSRAAPAAR